jgi:hypothetical protein
MYRGKVRTIRALGYSVLTVAECLGVAVDDWKPGALNVHHDLVALAETMAHVRQRELDERPCR